MSRLLSTKQSISWIYGPAGTEVFYGRNCHVGLIYKHKGWAIKLRRSFVLVETCGHNIPLQVALHFINLWPNLKPEFKPGVD